MMDKFSLAEQIRSSPPVMKERFIRQLCMGKTVVDLGCVRHSAEFALSDPQWLHAQIKAVAEYVCGVDYVSEEVAKLRAMGWNMIAADVTKPLELGRTFDVVVAADLIEHLSSFDVFLANCRAFLKPGGVLILTTPNPFYIDTFHFVAFKRGYFINPEHTCWLDPQALNQLLARFHFRIKHICFLKASWSLRYFITEGKHHAYDMLSGQWSGNTLGRKILRRLAATVFGFLYGAYKIVTGANTALVQHSDYLAVCQIEEELPA